MKITTAPPSAPLLPVQASGGRRITIAEAYRRAFGLPYHVLGGAA